MISKRKFVHFIEYNVGYLLLLMAVSFLSWYGIARAYTAPHEDERIDFFIMSSTIVDESFEHDLKEELNDEGLLEVNIYPVSPTDSDRVSLYERLGATSDMLILRGQDLRDMQEAIDINCLALPSPLVSELWPTSYGENELFNYESSNYAFKVYDAGDGAFNETHRFTSFCEFNTDVTGDNDYYLLFNKTSVNLGSFVENAQSDLAVKAAQFFFSRYH